MRLATTLVREPGERSPPPAVLGRVRTTRGRPRAHYRAIVRSPEDVEKLRRRRVPLFLLTDRLVSELGYPVRFRPWLVVPEALADPGLPELVTFVLRFDPLAARALALRNRRRIDPLELYRRIRNEGLERAATRVRLQSVARQLPKVGASLPRADLEFVDLNNPAIGSRT